MRLVAATFLVAAAALLARGAAGAPSPSRVVVYPRIDEPVSTLYTVRVRSAGGKWMPVDVYQAAVDWADPAVSAVALLSVGGPVQVQVALRGGRMHTATVEPSSSRTPYSRSCSSSKRATSSWIACRSTASPGKSISMSQLWPP